MTISFAIYLVFSTIIIGLLLRYVIIINKRQKADHTQTESENNEIINNVMQIVAYDYHVRVIKSGYAEIFDRSIKSGSQGMKLEDTIQWKCIEQEAIYNDEKLLEGADRYLVNFYKDKVFPSLKYTIKFRLFGNYYIAYGNNPLIAWAVVIRTARAENRRMFAKYK